MRIAVRPSKTFLWTLLDQDLEKITGDVGVDAASASFKSFPYFKTKKYFGIDISLDALKSGTNLYSEAVGLHGSLSEFDLPVNSVDLVVSTNTLWHLDSKQREVALEKLSLIVNQKGYFLVEIDNDSFMDTALQILNKFFSDIEVTYYQNSLSYNYEKIWEKDGFLGSHPLAGTKPFLFLSYLISRIEFLTCRRPGSNKHVYLRCTGKKQSSKDNKFDISDKDKIDERLYKI